jgi:hypothetical protein
VVDRRLPQKLKELYSNPLMQQVEQNIPKIQNKLIRLMLHSGGDSNFNQLSVKIKPNEQNKEQLNIFVQKGGFELRLPSLPLPSGWSELPEVWQNTAKEQMESSIKSRLQKMKPEVDQQISDLLTVQNAHKQYLVQKLIKEMKQPDLPDKPNLQRQLLKLRLQLPADGSFDLTLRPDVQQGSWQLIASLKRGEAEVQRLPL